jgi:proteasome lid subunit RPN8/RPN11
VLAAVWHSHVDAAAAPSSADRAGVWSGWLQVIVALRGDAVHEVRAFDLSGERPRELALAPLPCNRPFGALP